MSVMAYQITENSTVCSSTCSGIYQRKLHSSRHWPFMRGIHRWSINSSHKRPILERGKVSVSSGHHGACTLHSLPFAWWRHQMETFSRNRPFVRGIHQWRAALMFSLIYVWINGWVNNREAGVLRRYRGHYDVSVMELQSSERTGSRSWFMTPWHGSSRRQVINSHVVDSVINMSLSFTRKYFNILNFLSQMRNDAIAAFLQNNFTCKWF